MDNALALVVGRNNSHCSSVCEVIFSIENKFQVDVKTYRSPALDCKSNGCAPCCGLGMFKIMN